MLYYNKSMFADAGLDASKPPATIAELGEMAARLTDKPSKQWGFILTPELYQMSSWIGMQGGFLGNNESGRADTMTAVEFDKTGAMKNFLTEWKKAVDLAGSKPEPMPTLRKNSQQASWPCSSIQLPR